MSATPDAPETPDPAPAPKARRPRSREAMKIVSLRVPPALWDACLDSAEDRKEILSEEIRKFLEHYAERNN